MSHPPIIAVYPGTFDPITLGHVDIVRRASVIFDRVIVAVAVAHHKKTMFALEERMELVKGALSAYSNVSVESFTGLVRDFVVDRNAKVMVRGVRSVTDFDYENQLAGMNKHLMPEVETIFMQPNPQYQFISSTLVREIATLEGSVDELVSANVLASLKNKLINN